MRKVTLFVLLLASPAAAQFGPLQTLYRNNVKSFSGSLDVHGVASGTVSSYGSTDQYTTDQHVSGTLTLNTWDPLTASWTGTLAGTITIHETAVITIPGCTITNTFTASTSADKDFLGRPLTFNLSLDIGSDTWSLSPSNEDVIGHVHSVQSCGTSSDADQPMAFMPIGQTLRFPFPASPPPFDLIGSQTRNEDAFGNAASNPVTYTFTYNLKAETGPCTPSLSSPSQNFGPAESTGSVSFDATPDCTWTVTLPAPWVTVTSPTSGTGPGRIDFNVAANPGADRTTTIGIGGATFTINQSGAGGVSRLLPFAGDIRSGSLHYTTEMALTNNTAGSLPISILYTPSLGSKEGSGTVNDTLAPGEQKQIGDVLSYLRDKGLVIPSSTEQPAQGGTLLVTFQGSGIDPKLVSVTARTAALTTAPQPVGRAGLAYSGLLMTEASTSSLTLYGLRSSSTDRSNVAVVNMSADPVTLKVTVYSGAGGPSSVVFKAAETLPPYGWLQYPSSQILDGTGITEGWVTVERTSATGSFSAYAVINNSKTNDGSFVPPVGGAISGSSLTVPVLVESPAFRSELIMANQSGSAAALSVSYVESQSPALGPGSTIPAGLNANAQYIVPEAVDDLRSHGVNIGAKGAGSYGGALRVTVSGTATASVFFGARTASPSPAGGQFGLFTPGIYSGQEASSEAFIYGLRADAENRSNVAVVNTGPDSAGPIVLQLQAYDGDAAGAPKGIPVSVTLFPGQWAQPGSFFKNSGVANGWVHVQRLSGTAPWIAYGVVNDGGNPGERTGDGAYVPMVK